MSFQASSIKDIRLLSPFLLTYLPNPVWFSTIVMTDSANQYLFFCKLRYLFKCPKIDSIFFNMDATFHFKLHNVVVKIGHLKHVQHIWEYKFDLDDLSRDGRGQNKPEILNHFHYLSFFIIPDRFFPLFHFLK